MKIVNKVIAFLLAVFAFAGVSASALPVSAEENTGYSVDLTLKDTDTLVSGGHFAIAKVADLDQERQQYSVVDQYSKINADFTNISADNYAALAGQFASVAVPEQEVITGDSGKASFVNLGKGMYVVWETGREGMARNYDIAKPSLVSVPNWNGDNQTWENHVAIYPKTEKSVLRGPVKGVKSWEGDSVGIRPKEITLHLLANGEEVAETVATAEDNWAYKFEGVRLLDDNGDPLTFTVKEDPVDGYKFTQVNYIDHIKSINKPYVKIDIKNTHTPPITKIGKDPKPTPTPNPLKDVFTGDSGRIIGYGIAAGSALILLIVVLAEKKRRKEKTE